ncbi:YopX family protein [Streptococcus dysgalactiae]|uniref:YopX family protein n=1 Tax=Streptococcus dysgalactiae TaxID=1334 RepID=UPI0012A7DE41|nr:YopX family protein [Streptococcus dysgalactiae]QGH03222.1 hypothetical protein EA458_01025 [Streptococcus dysgalactiae subsp. dysgalactiae]QGH03557.1 hypothetical protein EA458_02930 [Streptococcus dysgalactiae subsp. dysgalactiae]QGH04938.1 hypothetical protein EA458_11075 [Streptococcus dysgalactiae subsp. dysgalactiae]WCE86482.1 YopX family protein [Streptococcus dysgalactiae]WCN26477.1 YopX family protein [Streptococcus dysgalactiae]
MIPKFRAWLDPDMYDEPVIHNGKFYLDWRDYEDGATYDLAVLMQSTGLKDKNGVEIFENDIVKVNGRKTEVIKFGQITHEEDFGGFAIYQGFSLNFGGGYPEAVMNELEVIGNIYELESVEE